MILAEEEDLRLIGLAADVDDVSGSLHQLKPDVIVLAFGWGGSGLCGGGTAF